MVTPINLSDDLRMGATGATAAWMNGVQVWPPGCFIDRGVIPVTGYTVWPWFTFSPDGTSIYFAGDNTIEEFTYPGFSPLGTYATAGAGYSVMSLGTQSNGDINWWETNFAGSWRLREGPGAILRTNTTGNYYGLCVSPYDDDIYTVHMDAAGDLILYRGYGLFAVSSAPAQDPDSSSTTQVPIIGTLDGGIWVGGGNGNVGRYDIPTHAQHYSPDNDDPGGGAYQDAPVVVSLMPRPDDTVSVVAWNEDGKKLTWADPPITIADKDCLDGFVGGASGYTPDLTVVAFWDGNDDHLYQLVGS